MTTKEKELLKKYIVVENPNYHGDEQYFIFLREDFDWIPACDTFDDYGQVLSHDEMCGEDSDDHYEIYAYSWWDGSNWKTTHIGSIDEGGIPEIDDNTALKILQEMPDESPYIEGTFETIETDHYSFCYTRYPVPQICSVD